MHRSDDDIHNLTEADRQSETRFGPRPVPEGHKTASPYPHRPMRSSKVIPSGRLGPDGKPWPEPSLTAKLLVWGGVAVGVAGATAAAVIATRKIADMISDDSGPRYQPVHHAPDVPLHDSRAPQTLAPRFAELDEEEREEIRRRSRAQAREDSRLAARRRVDASRRRHGPRNVASGMTETATNLSAGLNGLAESLTSAFNGFRSVAAQASAIIGEFASTAEQLRGMMGRTDAAPARDQTDGDRAEGDDDRRTHRL